MPIKIDCPRCRKPLAVPSKKAGGYVNCPECGGRFWVPETSLVEESSAELAAPPGVSPLPRTPNPAAVPPTMAVPDPPKPTPLRRPAKTPKVARLITPETVDSTLGLAEDGNLPELQLRESERKDASRQRPTSSNPLVLMAILSASILCCVLLVFWGESSGSGAREEKQNVERTIRDKYYSTPGRPLEPYQQWLREAQMAADRGDFQAERRLYRQVLDRLRVERARFDRAGLTGSLERDKELEALIGDLLRD